ncbi:MAG: glycoside hydrolase family 127 protein [Pirellulales bacterium]|nr:glycoside hydrolase family 127 protein [Pirellulales bacterium]
MMMTSQLRPFILFTLILTCSYAVAADRPAPSDDMRLTGFWGAAQARAAGRMAAPPLDSTDFILADLSLKQKRRYTEYSGDISGRWIGAAAFLAPIYPQPFAAFEKIRSEATTYQKNDGHFGADQDLPNIDHDRDKAILWGNGRLLIGLVEAYEQTGDEKMLQAAKKLGDYYIAIDPVFNKPEILARKPGGYVVNMETYYLSGIEGLAALGRVTKDARYLNEGKRIGESAVEIKNFDDIHSHGRLCAVRGFAELYAACGELHWLEAAERDWKIFMEKHRLPTGGIKEVLNRQCKRDEGCTISDWLRLNLVLWQLSGKGCYLDEAERCLKGHFIYNQYPNGGAGHRVLHLVNGRTVGFGDTGEEAWWCCSKHWARATADVARLAVTGGAHGPSINLMVDCAGSVEGPGGKWKIDQRETEDGLHVSLQSPREIEATLRIHRPSWAREGARLEIPAGLSLRESEDAWFVDGIWKGKQEIVVHLPTALRREIVTDNLGALLRGHDLMVAHREPANAWLMDKLPNQIPAVQWNKAKPGKNGRVLVPASLDKNADPNNPEQWKTLELAPLRAVADMPHDAAWYLFKMLPE